jgi:VIT1/CCC1 family predicted Fe2+/Mn2+ transporter
MTMRNPISERSRGVLYLLGVVIGGLAVVVGPLIVALSIPDAWAAVIVSLVGAVTSLLSLLARDNLPAPAVED